MDAAFSPREAVQHVDPNSDNDFGFDSDEEAQLAELVESVTVPLVDVDVAPAINHDATLPGVHKPRVPGSRFRREATPEERDLGLLPDAGPAIQIRYDATLLDHNIVPVPTDDSPGRIRFADSAEPESATAAGAAHDTRTPLERFRTAPRKPLSVTDLVSPAWCELQYWYSLTRYGRVRKTPAMKRGSSVHKVLEEQVHTTVPVDVESREDHWGLRIWNVIQGLRTLRVTGMTRELELWGTVDGQVVNGIIDELSYTCPDREMEAMLENKSKDGKKKQTQLAPDQATISEFFKSQAKTPASQDALKDARKIYLLDVKTRNYASIPKGASLRPTHMQLMLYRKLLINLATNSVDADIVFERYRLDPQAAFSDSLIRQLSRLDNFESSSEVEEEYAPMEADVDTAAELLQHNNLSKLWQKMMEEFRITMLDGAESISKILKVEYRSATDGSIMGGRTFLHDEEGIDAYVEDEMSWWKGKRAVKGVDVEEAFKCRICEFANDCEWRATKIDEAVQAHRRRSVPSNESQGQA